MTPGTIIRPQPTSLFSDRISLLESENAFKIGPHIQSVEASGKPVVRLNLGEPDFDIPSWVKEELKAQIDKNNTHYCDPKGTIGFRKAICNEMQRMRGLEVSPEQVVVFPGAKPSIGFAQQAYCNPGDEIIFPTPGFPIYESFIRYLGAVPVPYRLSEESKFAFTARRLEELITDRTRLIFLNFPSNPTGAVISREELEKIAEVIQRKASPQLRVYSDEIYEHIIYDGGTHVSIASIPGMKERTIISSGLSKTFAWTGGRLGYAVLPSVEEADVFKQLNINYFSCVAPFIQEAGRVALEHPESWKAVAKMVSIFQERRDVIWEQLNAISGVSCLKPQGAFYLFPNISGVCGNIGAIDMFNALGKEVQIRTSPATLFQMFALYHHGVALMDRRSFCVLGHEGQHYLRLSTAADLGTLQEGVRRFADATQDAPGFASFVRKGKNLY